MAGRSLGEVTIVLVRDAELGVEWATSSKPSGLLGPLHPRMADGAALLSPHFLVSFLRPPVQEKALG